MEYLEFGVAVEKSRVYQVDGYNITEDKVFKNKNKKTEKRSTEQLFWITYVYYESLKR